MDVLLLPSTQKSRRGDAHAKVDDRLFALSPAADLLWACPVAFLRQINPHFKRYFKPFS